MPAPFLSFVSPVYRAKETIPLLVAEIIREASVITENFEILLVEDGCPDNSWSAVLRETARDKRVKGISLSRNFGQHYAITAGLDYAKGTWIIVMDCDLQDKPGEIHKLLETANQGWDIVLARRKNRKDSFMKRWFSKTFYRTLSYLTGSSHNPAIGNFGIYHANVVQAIRTLREPIRYFPTMVSWVGFKRTEIDVEHGARELGVSSYNFKKLLKLSINIILTNSDKPIKLTIQFGFLVSLIAFGFGVFTAYRYYIGAILLMGYTSLLISIWFLAGLILVVLGVIGLYVGKTFQGVKNRPIYIIREQINAD